MQSWISPAIRLSVRTNSVYSGLPRPENGSTVRLRRIDTAVFGPPIIGELPKRLARKPTKTAQYSPYSGATPARYANVMACGRTSSAPVNPAMASCRGATARHHEKSGNASRSTFITAPAISGSSGIFLPENPGDAVVDRLRQFLQASFARVERTVLEADERSHIERFLMSEAALLAHRHVGPDESGKPLHAVESRAGIVGVQSPHRRNRRLALAVCAVAEGALALVHRLAARRIRIRAGVRQGGHTRAFRRTPDDFAFGKIADVRGDSEDLGGFLRRHDAVQAVQEAVADAQSEAVAYAVFCAPLRIDPGDIQRESVRLRAPLEMATATAQCTAGVAPGIPVGLHHDVVAEDDIGFIVIEHCARLQFLHG